MSISAANLGIALGALAVERAGRNAVGWCTALLFLGRRGHGSYRFDTRVIAPREAQR